MGQRRQPIRLGLSGIMATVQVERHERHRHGDVASASPPAASNLSCVRRRNVLPKPLGHVLTLCSNKKKKREMKDPTKHKRNRNQMTRHSPSISSKRAGVDTDFPTANSPSRFPVTHSRTRVIDGESMTSINDGPR